MKPNRGCHAPTGIFSSPPRKLDRPSMTEPFDARVRRCFASTKSLVGRLLAGRARAEDKDRPAAVGLTRRWAVPPVSAGALKSLLTTREAGGAPLADSA